MYRDVRYSLLSFQDYDTLDIMQTISQCHGGCFIYGGWDEEEGGLVIVCVCMHVQLVILKYLYSCPFSPGTMVVCCFSLGTALLLDLLLLQTLSYK